jgi:hypothetical protein
MNAQTKRQAKKIFEAWNPSAEQKLKQYVQLFPEQYEKFADSERAKIKGLNENDLYTLGRTFEQQIMTKQMNEEVTFAQLGATPTLAFDFITAMFGKSVIPYIASEQVIDEVQGLVYFENIVAQGVKHRVVTPNGDATVEVKDAYTGRGNIEPGDVLGRGAGAPDKYPQGYAGEMVYGEQLDATGVVDGSAKEFELTLLNAPIRRNYVKVIAKVLNSAGAEQKVIGIDDGKGNIIGGGIVGTVDYETGALKLTYTLAPEADTHIIANYATNFELGTLPSIATELDSKFVRANVYGLQTDTSIISSYMMGKRFNFDMQQRAVQLLQEHILNEITTELLFKIALAYEEAGETDTIFNMALPAGVSQQAHFNGVDYTFSIVGQKMARRSGKGTLSVALAGPDACAFLGQLAKFKKIGESTAFATVYGVYDDSTIVIRCPQLEQFDAVNGSKSIYFLYKGENPFDAAAVYAPYMPLVGVEDLPVPTALLNRRSAVASMAAVDVVVPGYIQKFVLAEQGGQPGVRAVQVENI